MKGERAKNQLIPPRGIKYKFWSGKKNSGAHLSKNKPGSFSISCIAEGCYYRQSSTGDAANDHSLKCGVDKPRVCPNGHVYPVNGYVPL